MLSKLKSYIAIIKLMHPFVNHVTIEVDHTNSCVINLYNTYSDKNIKRNVTCIDLLGI